MQNPAEQLKTVPLTILVPDLLKQFNKATLLGKRNVHLSKVEMDTIANVLENNQALPESYRQINAALAGIITESIMVLHEKFDLSFEQALKTVDVSAVAKWETTADFLAIANEKSNAELRISAACTLMVFLGDVSLVKHLLTVIRVDDGLNDVDAMIAKRALSHHTKIDINAEDWLSKIEATL